MSAEFTYFLTSKSTNPPFSSAKSLLPLYHIAYLLRKSDTPPWYTKKKPYFCGMNDVFPTIIDQELCREWLLPRPKTGHKGTFGHALLVAGSRGMMGAAVLSAQAALRSGIGKLTVHIPEAERMILQIALPEAILHFDENSATHFASPILLDDFQSVIIGPGIGKDGETQWALRAQLKLLLEAQEGGKNIPLVLDADALNLVSADFQMLSFLPKGTILTPHMGEMKRLCDALELPSYSEIELAQSAQQLAKELKLNIVLKSHETHIFTADGQYFLNQHQGNSGMATAGSGDVMTGLIGGLLAQGYAPDAATTLGVFLHASAGDFAAQAMDQHTLLASDIIGHLSQAFRLITS